MGYEIALNRAWDELEELSPSDEFNVTFLKDIHEVRVSERLVLRQPAGVPAREEAAILVLHYLIGLQKRGYRPGGEWVSFRQIEGGALFYPNLRDSTLVPLAESFGKDPEGLVRNLMECRGGRMVEGGDAAVEIEVLPEVAVRTVFWKGDEDFSPEATMLFDRGLAGVLSTEDIAVMLHLMVQRVTAGGAW
jgi:hypothetical protein